MLDDALIPVVGDSAASQENKGQWLLKGAAIAELRITGLDFSVKSQARVKGSEHFEPGGGSDGDRSVGCILPIGALLIAVRPPLRVAGRSKRATYRSPRQRKLSTEQVEVIRADAGNRTLRELAAEFGVSHETIRTVLR
jgi:hypothetical protein